MTSCEILIPNRYTWEAIELTVESILVRTDYPSYQIVVCDNSNTRHNGSRLKYLENLRSQGKIKLYRNLKPIKMYVEYGHGENLKILLRNCQADFAMLLSSGCEAISPHWLSHLIGMIKDDKDIGVAKLRPPVNHFDKCWAAPRFVPNWMLLNMRAYRNFGDIEEDWRFDRIFLNNYDHPEYFENLPKLKDPDCNPPRVFRDTGWRLYDRLQFENPEGYRMLSLPNAFHKNELRFYGGIDRNSHRPEHPHVVKTREEIQERLKVLRNEKC